MKKSWITFSVLVTITFGLSAQKLSFNEDGTFKIVQFTDMHYCHGNSKSDTALLLIDRILDAEKPDLVVFTGDIVLGPVHEGWDRIAAPVIEREIPFIVTLGNHDHEYGVTRDEIAAIVTAFPYNMNSPFVASLDLVMDNGIPIYGSYKPLHEKALVYCFDSGDYSSMNGVSGYDWITPDQIQWYREQSLFYTLKNNHEPLPAVAYFHIPLPEYRLASMTKIRGTGFEKKRSAVRAEHGHVLRDERNGRCDSMSWAMNMNDYIVDYHGMPWLTVTSSGWRTTYIAEINGARVVVLKEERRELIPGCTRWTEPFERGLPTPLISRTTKTMLT